MNFIDEFKRYNLTEHIMIYHVSYNNIQCEFYDDNENDNFKLFSSAHDTAKYTSTYLLPKNKYINLNKYIECIKKSIEQSDYGITIILKFLAIYITTYQLPLFFFLTQSIPEIELIDKIFTSKIHKFHFNFPIDPEYGISVNKHLFNNSSIMTIENFKRITYLFFKNLIDPPKFIKLISDYDINIIESLYTLFSAKINKALLTETHNVCLNTCTLNYSFKKFEIVTELLPDISLWFELPASSIFFAYTSNGFTEGLKISSPIVRNDIVSKIKEMFVNFKLRNDILVGIITPNRDIIPLYIESLIGKWKQCVDLFIKNNYNNKFFYEYDLPIVQNSKVKCFLIENNINIYKLKKVGSI